MKLLILTDLQDGTPRGNMSLGVKRQTYEAHGGLCIWCDRPVPWIGAQVDYDHRVPLALGGADTAENIGPIHHDACHPAKTRQDIKRIAKAKRQRKLIEPVTKSKRPLQGRGFITTLTRGFDGITRRRKA